MKNGTIFIKDGKIFIKDKRVLLVLFPRELVDAVINDEDLFIRSCKRGKSELRYMQNEQRMQKEEQRLSEKQQQEDAALINSLQE